MKPTNLDYAVINFTAIFFVQKHTQTTQERKPTRTTNRQQNQPATTRNASTTQSTLNIFICL